MLHQTLTNKQAATEEIEIKLKINDEDFNTFMDWLSKSAEFIGESLQEDYYFDNPDTTWFKTHKDGYRYALQYLRVRISVYGDTLCFKDWETGEKKGEAGLYCQDIETNISDGKRMISLLEKIGFSHKTKFKKRRRHYIYGDFEISIDSVDGLGTFVEFEAKKRKYLQPEKEYDRILEIINTVGIKQYKIQKQGFIVLLWNPDFDFSKV